ncbi:MAG: HNH endonuclease [Oligoflexia bacterium]|nr:HNH endonuclease [Oligoflexia bacterium]
MNLKLKSNKNLLQEIKHLATQERDLLMQVLHYLREIELRKLHLSMGYPDLYVFAQKELGYSNGAAYRRIAAMRLLESVPEAGEKLQSGELHLESASAAQSAFRKEDLRRRNAGEIQLTKQEKSEIIKDMSGKSTRQAEHLLFEKLPEVAPLAEEKMRPLADQKTLIQFAATPELMEKLEELKNLMAHQNYDGRMDVLVEKLADLALQKWRPKVSNAQEPQKTEAKTPAQKSPAPGVRTRYISTAVKEAVKLRDQACTYRDPKSGRVCGSKHGLQFDHIQAFSQDGPNTAENLTLLCGAHNRWKAELEGLVR